VAAATIVATVVSFGVTAAASSESPGPIPADCSDNPLPSVCGRVVAQIQAELNDFNRAFNPPNPDTLAAFYHEQAILYVHGTAYRGKTEIRNGFFVPFANTFSSGTVDTSAFRYQVIGESKVITYGALTAEAIFTNGHPFHQPPLPQSLVWVRNDRADGPRFVIISDHE
jgi:ketosteroid isomerase-like protein